MDKNERQEEQAQGKQQKSAIDRLNQGIDTARNAKSTLVTAKKGAKAAKKAAKTLRTASTVIRGGQAAVAVISALVSTAPVWVPVALIVGFFALVIIAVIVIFTGVATPPTCKSLTANPTTISNSVPAILTLENCSENITYSWNLPQIGGTFSASQSATTSYTPPKVSSGQKIHILVNVCSSSNQSNCSQYSTPQLTISKEDLFSCNGYCTTATSCSSPDSPGQGTCPITPSMICCKRENNKPGPAPSCNEIDQRLRQDYNLRTKEGAPPSSVWGPTITESVDCAAKQGLWKIYSILIKSWKFKNKLLGTSATIQFFRDSGTSGGYGYTGWAYLMQLHNGAARIKSNLEIAGAWITHETGHLLQKRDGSLEARFPLDRLRRIDSGCYAPGSGKYWLKTYSLRGGNISPIRESMAEGILLYVYNRKYNVVDGRLISILNFKRECPATYNWVRENVFGGYEYN